MRTYDTEMTVSRKVYDMRSEIKSPEDIVNAETLVRDLLILSRCRTYDLFIASDTLTDSEET